MIRKQTFLGRGKAACLANVSMRHEIYKNYGKILNNIWLGRNMECLRRKATGAGSDSGLLHRREIMPKCVVNAVRRMYPNPEGKSYVGHQWGD